MRSAVLAFVFSILAVKCFAQIPDRNIFSRDTFPAFVKSVRLSAYATAEGPEKDTLINEMNSTYMEFDSTGHWTTRIDVFSDQSISEDSAWYEKKTRTRFLRKRNAYDRSVTSTLYNADGSIQHILFDSELRDDVNVEFEYDKKKRLLKRTETFTDQKRIEQYTYNKPGLLTRKLISAGLINDKKTVPESEQQYVYNKKRQLIQMFELIYNGIDVIRVRDTVWYTYDEAGRLAVQTESRQNGQSKIVISYQYDAVGRITVMDYHYTSSLDGSSNHVAKMSYDEKGFLSSLVEEMDEGGSSLQWKTTYNNRGLPVSCLFSTEAEVFYYKWEYVYR